MESHFRTDTEHFRTDKKNLSVPQKTASIESVTIFYYSRTEEQINKGYKSRFEINTYCFYLFIYSTDTYRTDTFWCSSVPC